MDFEYPVIKGPAQLLDASEVGWSAEYDLFTTFKMTALLGASTGSLTMPEKVAEKWCLNKPLPPNGFFPLHFRDLAYTAGVVR